MWPALIPIIGNLLEKFIPDPQAAAEAKLKMLAMVQQGDLAQLDADMKLALGQLDVDKAEATTDLFRGGWRPGAGWVCVLGLAYQFLLMPLLPWIAHVAGANVPPLPTIDIGTLFTLLAGMLGLGTLRTAEKLKGVQKKNHSSSPRCPLCHDCT